MPSDPAPSRDQTRDQPRGTSARPVAYLVNVYPAVSHTFVRSEIQALEKLGQPVLRFSVRAAAGLVDPADVAEDGRTTVLLERGRLWGPALRACGAPARLLRALRQCRAMARNAGGGVGARLRHGVYLAEACRLKELTARAGVAHLHAHFGTNPAAVARLCHLLGGPTYSFTVHGPEEFDRPIHLSLSSKVADARFVAGVSSFGKSQLMRWLHRGLWDKVAVVPCGLDGDWLGADPEATPDGDASLASGGSASGGGGGGGGGPASDLLVCVGRLCEQKGQHLLVEAVDRLTRRGVSVRLRLIGDGPMRAGLEAAARERGIADRVEFTGNATAEAIRGHLRECRGFVLPSFAEGLPVVIMEALAMRRPVVSTYVAGIPELVDPACGHLVPAGDVDGLTEAMEALLAEPPERIEEMGAEGRRRVAERHDVDAIAAGLLRLFSEAPGRAGAGRDRGRAGVRRGHNPGRASENPRPGVPAARASARVHAPADAATGPASPAGPLPR